MSFLKFQLQLAIITILVIAIGWMFTWDTGDPLFIFYLLSAGLFTAFSIFIWLYADRASKSRRLASFQSVVALSFLVKLLLFLGMIILFEKKYNPDSQDHIFHFIGMYIVYMIYEVYYLTRLAHQVPLQHQ